MKQPELRSRGVSSRTPVTRVPMYDVTNVRNAEAKNVAAMLNSTKISSAAASAESAIASGRLIRYRVSAVTLDPDGRWQSSEHAVDAKTIATSAAGLMIATLARNTIRNMRTSH